MRARKIFAGAKLRSLRQLHGMTQSQLAARLEVSTSYVNQIENNQRPLTAALMLALAEKLNLDLSELMTDQTDRLLADLREVLADPIFDDTAPGLIEQQAITANSPDMAHALIKLYAAYRKSHEKLASVDAALTSTTGGGMQTAYEEVRDFFHYANNHIDPLDRAAEDLANELFGDQSVLDRTRDSLAPLAGYLSGTHDVSLKYLAPDQPETLRSFSRSTRTLFLNERLNPATAFFQVACQLAEMEQTTLIGQILDSAEFKTQEARQVCRIGLANYFAGALQMPYGWFLAAAEQLHYDIEELATRFGASLEQVAHRLSTMQREGARGVPFFFARVDAAGTITKRHSATPLQFARFGSACPLWNVHRAFEARGKVIRQLAETPEGNRYLCLAWSSEKRVSVYGSPVRRYAYALGCEVTHASKLVYANDLRLDEATAYDPIGISCRTCERRNCVQRSVPPIAATINVTPDQRSIVPYEIG